MRLILEVWVFGLAIALTPFWTKWYLPIDVRLTKYISSGELTVSLLWFIHFSARFPFSKIDKEIARKYIQR